MSLDEPPEAPFGIDPAASGRIFLGMLALVVGAALTYIVLKRPESPPPVSIAADPLLAEGFRIYQDRCLSCHGRLGKGDGPTARVVTGPPVGDLSDDDWKHGDRPEQVLAVIGQGVKEAQMAGWSGVLGPEGVRAVAAYVYHLAGREVPAPIRLSNAKGQPTDG